MRYTYAIAITLDGDAMTAGTCTDVEVIEGVLSIRDEAADTERLVAPGFWAECDVSPEKPRAIIEQTRPSVRDYTDMAGITH